MPLMIVNRDHTLTTLRGVSIKFKKDVPQFVPDHTVEAAVGIGALMAPKVEGEAPTAAVLPEKIVVIPGRPTSEAEVKAKIEAAFDDIVTRNARLEFSGNGIPTAKAVSRVAGWDVEQGEIKKAWTAYRAARAEAAA